MACSRDRYPSFPYGRLSNLSNSQRLQERLMEDDRLQTKYQSSFILPIHTDQDSTAESLQSCNHDNQIQLPHQVSHYIQSLLVTINIYLSSSVIIYYLS